MKHKVSYCDYLNGTIIEQCFYPAINETFNFCWEEPTPLSDREYTVAFFKIKYKHEKGNTQDINNNSSSTTIANDMLF